MAGSSTPSPILPDRGRRRTRTQIADPVGTTDGGECTDGWIGVGEDDVAELFCQRTEGEDSDDEGSVSEVLADAILKRPGSIKGLSSKRGKPKEKEPFVEQAEFTFPSLSDLGNVNRGYSRSVPACDGDDVKAVNEVAPTTIATAQLPGVEVNEP
jgi:hypothetical protein